jgi:hypothetical protein
MSNVRNLEVPGSQARRVWLKGVSALAAAKVLRPLPIPASRYLRTSALTRPMASASIASRLTGIAASSRHSSRCVASRIQAASSSTGNNASCSL